MSPLGSSIKLIATHEAGHYVVGLCIGVPVQEARIDAEDGGVLVPSGWTRRADPDDVATFRCGGYAAERLVVGQFGLSHQDDDLVAYSSLYASPPEHLPLDWFVDPAHERATLAFRRAQSL